MRTFTAGFGPAANHEPRKFTNPSQAKSFLARELRKVRKEKLDPADDSDVAAVLGEVETSETSYLSYFRMGADVWTAYYR